LTGRPIILTSTSLTCVRLKSRSRTLTLALTASSVVCSVWRVRSSASSVCTHVLWGVSSSETRRRNSNSSSINCSLVLSSSAIALVSRYSRSHPHKGEALTCNWTGCPCGRDTPADFCYRSFRNGPLSEKGFSTNVAPCCAFCGQKGVEIMTGNRSFCDFKALVEKPGRRFTMRPACSQFPTRPDRHQESKALCRRISPRKAKFEQITAN
jgi:hypothetical protein